jgi:MFS family permease
VAGRIRARLGESFGAFRDVFANPNLRRVELAWAGTNIGRWAYFVALAVYAYEQGGAAAVGLVALIRMFPSAIAAPFTSILGDRYPRQRVMFLASVGQAATIGGAAAIALADGAAPLVYTFVGLNSIIGTAFRPAQAAVLPSLAKTPKELTAANVVASTVESIGIFIGPAIGGTILAFSSSGTVFAVTSVTFLWSAFLIARLDVPPAEPRERPSEGKLRQAFAGFGTILTNRPLRLLEAMAAAQTLVAGAFNVLVVVSALELLDIGKGGVGALNSAVGVGGLIGALVAAVLVGRERLAGHFAFGMLLWGIPIALIGIFPDSIVALPLLLVVGIGNTIVDVAGLTLLQRAVPDNVMARVFGAVNSVTVGTLGLGAMLAPLLIELIGIRGALIATGALLPVLTALLFRGLAELDTGAIVEKEKLDLLRSHPIFAPLPEPSLETLAAKLAEVRHSAGETVFRQGDYGDRYYLIADGTVDVTVDGQRTRSLGPGEGFGEIALLRDVPRTATVTAASDVKLYALERDDFIAVVTGHADSAERADALIASRTGTLRAELGTVY